MQLQDYIPLIEKLKKGEAVELPMHALGNPHESVVNGLITSALRDANAVFLESTVLLALSELLKNAEQAIFLDDFLEAENKAAEPALLRKCAHELRSNIAAFRAAARKKTPRLLLHLKRSPTELRVVIASRANVRAFQRERIEQRLALADRAGALGDLLSPALATENGDGYGAAFAAFALRSAGLKLEFTPGANQAQFAFSIPVGLTTPDRLARIDGKILQEVDTLPAFPENIRRMRETCESESAGLKQVAAVMQQDQVIAGQIVRLANSGGFAGGKVADLMEAVKIVGLKNVSQLLLQIGAIDILHKKYGAAEDLVEHPARVAFFSRSLARKQKRAAVADTAYAAGLLHDIGKVVLMASMSARADYQEAIKHRDRRSAVELEEVACGAGHALIGGLLARKWNFPESLVTAIELHHSPGAAPAQYRDLVHIVYLANAMADYLDGSLSFYAVEAETLERFNLATEDAFQMLAAAIDQEYQDRR